MSQSRTTTRHFKEGDTDTPRIIHKFDPHDIAEERCHHQFSPVECTLTVNLSNLLWQTAAHRLTTDEVQSVDDPIGCAAFRANAQQPRDFDVTITSLLPLCPDDSKFVVTIRHSMEFVQRAVHRLNPGQVPVLTQD